MTDFYQLQPNQQSAAYKTLAHRALQQWGITGAELELLKMRENAVFSVRCDNGARYAMRIHRAGYHHDDELRSELQWMMALDERGIHTPGVVPTVNGKLFDTVSVEQVPEPRQVDLLDWIDGEQMGSIEDGVTGSIGDLVASYRRIGALAARVHNISSQWQVPEGFVRHHWDIDGLVGEQPVWGRFWEYEKLNRDEREIILRAREIIREQLTAYGKNDSNYGLIHADFLPENLMICGDSIKLIDFDDSGYGWYLFELATSLFVHLGEPHYDEVFAALIEGYRSERSLEDKELAYLPVFLTARLFSYLGWLHTREATDSTEEMAPIIQHAAVTMASELLLQAG